MESTAAACWATAIIQDAKAASRKNMTLIKVVWLDLQISQTTAKSQETESKFQEPIPRQLAGQEPKKLEIKN
jgi:hypothetical protein